MRKKLSFINGFAGAAGRIMYYLVSFIVRLFFAKYMLKELLGYEGLFANILGLLSVADLGIGATIAYSLYKPIHEKDEDLVSAYMALYKKAYYVVGLVIFAAALILRFNLGYLIKDNQIDLSYIKTAFTIYSLGIVLSYFWSYDRTIIFARQNNYIVSIVDSLAQIICGILQIFTIVVFHNYLLYLSIIVIEKVISNLVISQYAKKKEYYNRKTARTLTRGEKDTLIDQCKNVVITSVLGKGVNSTDNILISSLVGTTGLAINSNYSLIVTAVQSLITTFLGGATASIGDLIAENDQDKIDDCFIQYSFLYSVIAGISLNCFYFISSPFITLCFGEDFLFSRMSVILISVNIFLYLVQQPIWTFQNTAGLFASYKWVSLGQTVINIIVSLIAGKIIGINGIFLGTTLCYIFSWGGFFFNLKRHTVHTPNRAYFAMQFQVALCSVVCSVILFIIHSNVNIGNVLSIIITLATVFIIYCAGWFGYYKNRGYSVYIALLLRRFVNAKNGI